MKTTESITAMNQGENVLMVLDQDEVRVLVVPIDVSLTGITSESRTNLFSSPARSQNSILNCK
jgi:hypothetical protein